MSSKTYKSIERRVGEKIEEVARNSCSQWLLEEKKQADGNNFAISYDGVAEIRKGALFPDESGLDVDQSTGKVIDYKTKKTSCQKCENVASSGGQPSSYDCRLNHCGSLKSL